MAGVLHGSARTTPRVRAELQASQETTSVLAARYGLNPKTVQKWRKRTTTADQPIGSLLHGSGGWRDRVARIRGAGAMPPPPFWAHAMRTDSGRPSSSMRFRTWTATSISVA